MATLDSVVETFVSAMVRIGRQTRNPLDIAAQLVGDDDPRLTKSRDQPVQEPPCRLGVATGLNPDFKRVPVSIDSPPEPLFYPVDLNNDLFQMPFAIWSGTVPADARREMRAKPVDPKTYRFSADNDTPLRQETLDIRRAERKPVIGPDRISDDLAGETKTFQARKRGWYTQDRTPTPIAQRKQLGNAPRSAAYGSAKGRTTWQCPTPRDNPLQRIAALSNPDQRQMERRKTANLFLQCTLP